MPYTHLHHISYHYQRHGTGETVLLLHGFTGRGRTWDKLLERISGPYQWLTVDLLGHGLTDSPLDPTRYEMRFAAADLAALILDLATPPIHLLGYSMGGRLALYLAIHYPHLFHSLTLESSSPGLATAEERQARQAADEQLAQKLEREGVDAFMRYWQQLPLFASQNQLPEPVRVQLTQQRRQNSAWGLANSLRGMGTGRQPSLWDQLPGLNLPVRLLAGALDHKFVIIARQMAARLPQAELIIVPQAGHTIHLEQPDSWIAAAGFNYTQMNADFSTL
ncbi:MAG: 2-succinyl-6-hydroxy-2,4-cyclohexadiene-1-carboxylate synthase [Anaerolineae bacterium]|nr:2-succinyl-6-hydroxy-2,4-cyclohexadiene-1-carboxylate synthase [Anaerolineae bacterium]